MDYMAIIKYATLTFPFVAFLFTLPFILMEYHKYGSISFFKSIIIYIFIYYLICAYFLVILPLPKIREVTLMTGPTMQLQPFKFVVDFLNKSSFILSDFNTYKIAISENYFYVPLFNIFLTVPFGMFLRYFFKCSWKKTILCSFLLSLFFELTQLSGLYFIYPRPYRLFDVDDLILNTLGGSLGYLLGGLFSNILPSIDEVRKIARNKGKIVTGFRRTVALMFDFGIVLFLILISKFSFFKIQIFSGFIVFIYYFVMPLFLHNQTIGEKFLNLQIVGSSNTENLGRLIFRRLLFGFIYIVIPNGLIWMIVYFQKKYFSEIYAFLLIMILVVSYLISICKFVFTNKLMLYEKLSKTKIISTIK